MRAGFALSLAVLVPLGADAAAEGRPGRVRTIAVEPSEMVKVPAGAFDMGMPESADGMEEEVLFVQDLCEMSYRSAASAMCSEVALHLAPATTPREVHLSAFAIDRHEVRVRDYRECVKARGCDIAALLFGDQRYNQSDLPVGNVTHDEARAYCEWRGKRLPTEAEWEKAARGSKGWRFPWGNHWAPETANHGGLRFELEREYQPGTIFQYLLYSEEFDGADDADGFRYPAPPGTMVWGESTYGAADMAGNVSEWVADYFDGDGYSDLPKIDPHRDVPSQSGSLRSVRGGSWLKTPLFLLSYFRYGREPETRSRDLGFRCARSIHP